MKVLLVTGTLAEDTVKRYAKESYIDTETLRLEKAVAALLTPQDMAEALRNTTLESFDFILVPGLVRGDTAVIKEATGIPAFKGPKYAADLGSVLNSLGEIELSTIIPACDLIKEKLHQKALQEIEKVEANRAKLLERPGNMLVGNVAVGKDFPMRVLAEIVDAALMDKRTIQQAAKHFLQAGADLIDVGMIVGESKPQKAKHMVEWVKQVVNVPVSIDTLNPAEIRAAVKAGADLVLSADAGNLDEIAPCLADISVVIIPTNQRMGIFPKKAAERVRFLEEIVAKARNLGVKHCLADLILDPSDILESFLAFKEFSCRNPDVPIFVGVSNVTELFDADSVGLNALLARLSSEVGGSIMLATERSNKARGTVVEEVSAAKMMFLAKRRGSVPKDLGVDLLILKDKRLHEEPYSRKMEVGAEVIRARAESEPAHLGSEGIFKINVDHIGGLLIAAHYLSVNVNKPIQVVKGETAEMICTKIIKMGLVKRLDHAAYLGSELSKAEIALRTGKEYVQDCPLFKK